MLPEKLDTWRQVGFDVIFKGDDWRARRRATSSSATSPPSASRRLLPYTVHTSSTQLRRALDTLLVDTRT